MNLALPVVHRLKIKENKKRDKYFEHSNDCFGIHIFERSACNKKSSQNFFLKLSNIFKCKLELSTNIKIYFK